MKSPPVNNAAILYIREYMGMHNIALIILILRNDYVYQFHALFKCLIPEDILPGDSKAIGIIALFKTVPIPS